jgi:Cu/Ag efflux protein CusF
MKKERRMKTIAALGLVAVLLMAGVAMAAETEGMIKSVDPAAKEVALDNGMVITFDDTTTVTIQGAMGKLEDLKEGAKVKASYDEKDGKNVATSLEVSQ